MAIQTIPLPLEFHNGEEPLTIEIPLTKGYKTIVDAIDGDLSLIKWTTTVNGNRIYVYRNKNHQYLHRAILSRMINRELTDGELVDHIDSDGLNNRRSNLRLAIGGQNNWNSRKAITNTSGFKGVSFDKRKRRWESYIWVKNKKIHLGFFDTPEEASLVRNDAAIKLHGEFARFE